MHPSVLVKDSKGDGVLDVELAVPGTRLHLALVAPAQQVQLQSVRTNRSHLLFLLFCLTASFRRHSFIHNSTFHFS
jgi:hypothetical protein